MLQGTGPMFCARPALQFRRLRHYDGSLKEGSSAASVADCRVPGVFRGVFRLGVCEGPWVNLALIVMCRQIDQVKILFC